MDFPQISGYGREYPPQLVAAGRVTPVKADSIVEKDDQILLVRPMEYSERAEQQRLKAAREQVEVHTQRLHASSALPHGRGRGNTEVVHGRQYANPDTLPEFRSSQREI